MKSNIGTVFIALIIGFLSEILIVLIISLIVDNNVDTQKLKNIKNDFLSFYNQQDKNSIDYLIDNVRDYEKLKAEIVPKKSNGSSYIFSVIFFFWITLFIALLAD